MTRMFPNLQKELLDLRALVLHGHQGAHTNADRKRAESPYELSDGFTSDAAGG